MNNKQQKIFSINFNLLTMDELINVIDTSIKDNKKLNIVVVNAAVLVMSQKDDVFLKTINKADIVTVDGMPLLWAIRLLGFDISEKLSGPDIFTKILKLANKNKYSTYFLGTKQEILNKMIKNIKNKYPLLPISGYRNGFFKREDESQIIDEINSSKTNILFLGIPSPTKERFIENKELKTNLSMGVGGVFDIEAGIVKRAPIWMQNNGLEWIYRLFQEPKRLWKRYLVTNTLFIFVVLKEIIKRRFKNV